MSTNRCNICKVVLTDGGITQDMGGDCAKCMAECGDNDAAKIVGFCEALALAYKEFDRRGLYGAELLLGWSNAGKVE